jgi:hypothetical protein
MVELFLCSVPTANGDLAFKVDSKETYDAFDALECQAISEADFWGGMQFNVSPNSTSWSDNLEPEYAQEITAEKLKESEKYYDLEQRYHWLMGEDV